MSTGFAEFLEQSLGAGSPLIYCETSEDARLRDIVFDLVADRRDTTFMTWTCTAGLVASDEGRVVDVLPTNAVQTFEQLLGQLVAAGTQSQFERNLVLVARDAVGAGNDGEPGAPLRFLRLLKDLHELWDPGHASRFRRSLVFTGLGWRAPPSLNGYVQTRPLPPPARDEIRQILDEETDVAAALPQHGLDLESLSARVAGLPVLTIRDIARRLERLEPRGDDAALTLIDRTKKEEIRKTGVLEVMPTDERIELGGFAVFKRWFAERKPFLLRGERPELRPRGVMLLGFPGCGKSHAARWVARDLGLPLIAMNLGQVQERWVGTSEANLMVALRTLEAAAPLVLFMDEIEKEIAGHGQESTGVMTRMVGTLLRWMADRQAPIFIVATCNREQIPSEFARAGRFDTNFIVSLPQRAQRGEILDVVARRLQLEVPQDVRTRILDLTDRFTGAEVQQLLIEAAYICGEASRTLTRQSVEAARPRVRPLIDKPQGQELWNAYEALADEGYSRVDDPEVAA